MIFTNNSAGMARLCTPFTKYLRRYGQIYPADNSSWFRGVWNGMDARNNKAHGNFLLYFICNRGNTYLFFYSASFS